MFLKWMKPIFTRNIAKIIGNLNVFKCWQYLGRLDVLCDQFRTVSYLEVYDASDAGVSGV